MLKIALVRVKNIFFGLKKSISELLHWIAQKLTANRLTDCYVLHVVIERYFPIHLFNTILITLHLYLTINCRILLTLMTF